MDIAPDNLVCFQVTRASFFMVISEPRGILAEYAITITEMLERCSILTVCGVAVVENPILFPGDMRCLYRDCKSNAFVKVPVTEACPLGHVCGKIFSSSCSVTLYIMMSHCACM